MQKADLPSKIAQEPDEGAYQPPQDQDESVVASEEQGKTRKTITFAEGTQSTEVSSSQNTCSYKEALSQPGPGLSHRQRLLWLQKRRSPGLWVQCDDCNCWRFLPHIIDSHELPKRWCCKMNPDRSAADCSVPEAPIKLRDEEDLIHSEYSAGSVVWARLGGWPWWPAMVDDCPDTEQFYWLDGFSDIPTHYNVVFFDAFEVTRAWISPENLKPYASNKKSLKNVTKNRRYKKRLEIALGQADDADMLPLADRLNKYCFINRYKGNIGNPNNVSKKDIRKFKKKIQKKLNIDFSDDSDVESINSTDSESAPVSPKRRAMKKKNVILIGTPKKTKRTKVQGKSNDDIIDVDAHLADSHNAIEPARESNDDNTELQNHRSNDNFKQPNSMTVQVSCTPAVDTDTMNIDNDSSKTYLPNSMMSPPSADVTQTQSDFQDLQVRIPTPSSDDFEF